MQEIHSEEYSTENQFSILTFTRSQRNETDVKGQSRKQAEQKCYLEVERREWRWETAKEREGYHVPSSATTVAK